MNQLKKESKINFCQKLTNINFIQKPNLIKNL